MMRKASVVLACLLLLVHGVVTGAQETRGSIEGVVKDASGGVLPGVTVEARNAQGGVTTAVTDADGKYRFPALSPGRYAVTAALDGFKKASFDQVDLLLGQLLQVNFDLQVGGISEDVQVIAESPIIDVKQNAAGATIQREIIDLIPKGRDFTDLAKSAPGAADESRGGGLMIDGASGSENRYIVDGLDTTQLRQGESQVDVVSEFIEQLQIKTSGYNAESRATTGGVVSAITRSGTNRYSGEFGTHYENNRWRGDLRPALRLNPSNATQAQYTLTPRDKGETVEPTFTLGGPVLRDRMWFFAGYVPQVTTSERTLTFTGDRAAGPRTFSNRTEDHNVTYSLSGQLTPKFRSRFSGSHQPNTGSIGHPAIEPDFIQTLGVDSDFVRVPDSAFRTSTANAANFPGVLYNTTFTDTFRSINDWVVSPRVFVNVTAGYLRYGTRGQTLDQFNTNTRRTFTGATTCTGAPGSSGCPFPEIPEGPLRQVNAYADSISNSRTVRDDYTRFELKADTTYYANWKGQHSLKAGVQYERLGNDVLSGEQATNITLNWNASRTTIDAVPRIVRGQYGYYIVRRNYTEGVVTSNNYGLFIQDAWTISNNLTLNLGLRADQEDVPSYRPENPGIHFNFAEKLSPRAGFAYDIKGDGRWKAYGSWGVFYDISKLELPRGSFGANRWINYYWTLDDFNWDTLDCTGEANSGCRGTFIEQVDNRHVSNGTGADNLVDPDLKPIRTQEFTLGAEHQLARTMSISARYVHKWLDRTIEDVGITVPGVGEVFYISNPGEGITENLLRDVAGCSICPNQPKPVREYDAIELRFQKRLSDRWYGSVQYTFGRLFGNYSGLASSDENGRNAPSVNRFFDGQYMSFDQNGNPVLGDLGTDRPHQFEVQAGYQLPWGTDVGVYYLLGTGLPQSQTITVSAVPVFNLGRGTLGRTPALSQTDLNVMQQVRIKGQTRFTVEVNVINLFDQATAITLNTTPYRDPIPVSASQFFSGFDAAAIAAATPSIRPDPRFGQAATFQGDRRVRIAAKFRF